MLHVHGIPNTLKSTDNVHKLMSNPRTPHINSCPTLGRPISILSRIIIPASPLDNTTQGWKYIKITKTLSLQIFHAAFIKILLKLNQI